MDASPAVAADLTAVAGALRRHLTSARPTRRQLCPRFHKGRSCLHLDRIPHRTGPFTQVPLPGNRQPGLRGEAETQRNSPHGRCNASLQVERQMQSMLGRVTVEPGRQIYPLSAVTPLRFARERGAVMKRPCFRRSVRKASISVSGISTISLVLLENRTDPALPRPAALRFQRRPIFWRAAVRSICSMAVSCDMLVPRWPVLPGSACSVVAPLRAFFMREGLRPGSGFAALAGGLRRPAR